MCVYEGVGIYKVTVLEKREKGRTERVCVCVCVCVCVFVCVCACV